MWTRSGDGAAGAPCKVHGGDPLARAGEVLALVPGSRVQDQSRIKVREVSPVHSNRQV